MQFRKPLLFLALVSLCILPTWGTGALARPVVPHESSIAAQSTGSIHLAGTPAYDSGWQALGARPDPIPVPLTHNLGGDPDTYLVDLECMDDTSLGTYDCNDQQFNVNGLWYALTNTSVTVWVSAGTRPDAVRVRIYTETPAYDSGWEALGARPDPIPVPFTHNLGGDPDDYIVDLQCQDDTVLGTYDCSDQQFNINALWYGMTATEVTAWVAAGPRPDAVRIRLYTGTPAYDSGWQTLGARPDPIPVPLTHSLGGDPDSYLVDLECRDDTVLGTYECTNQQFNLNGLWYDLTGTTVDVWAAGGTQPDEVRVRIWLVQNVYLPVVIRN
jgi:hypothetical protein